MKRLILAVMLATCLFAEPPQGWPVLKTKDGKEFTEVKVTGYDAVQLKIMHAAGMARIPFQKLPEEIQKAFGYDPAKAADHLAGESAQKAVREESQARAALVNSSRKIFVGKIFQVAERGVLLENVQWGIGKKEEVGNEERVLTGMANGLHKSGPTYGTRTTTDWDYVMRPLGEDLVMVKCKTSDLVDGGAFTGVVYPFGTYSYTAVSGARKTIKAYTTSVSEFLERELKGK